MLSYPLTQSLLSTVKVTNCVEIIVTHRGCAYDVDHRNPKLCSIQSEAIYDLTHVDNAMYRKGIHGSSTFIVLNGLSYGVVCLFDSFVSSRSMIEGTTSTALKGISDRTSTLPFPTATLDALEVTHAGSRDGGYICKACQVHLMLLWNHNQFIIP